MINDLPRERVIILGPWLDCFDRPTRMFWAVIDPAAREGHALAHAGNVVPLVGGANRVYGGWAGPCLVAWDHLERHGVCWRPFPPHANPHAMVLETFFEAGPRPPSWGGDS